MVSGEIISARDDVCCTYAMLFLLWLSPFFVKLMRFCLQREGDLEYSVSFNHLTNIKV